MHELVAEADRLGRHLSQMMQLAPVVDEVPLRLHARETDAGGAPEFHPAFVRYIGSVCTCGRAGSCAPNCRYVRDQALGHLPECSPPCRVDTRFHASQHRNSPTRMKRALRQLRRLNPAAYDFCYLVIAHHASFEAAAAKINADRLGRGQNELTLAQFAVLWVSGASMLTASF